MTGPVRIHVAVYAPSGPRGDIDALDYLERLLGPLADVDFARTWTDEYESFAEAYRRDYAGYLSGQQWTATERQQRQSSEPFAAHLVDIGQAWPTLYSAPPPRSEATS